MPVEVLQTIFQEALGSTSQTDTFNSFLNPGHGKGDVYKRHNNQLMNLMLVSSDWAKTCKSVKLFWSCFSVRLDSGAQSLDAARRWYSTPDLSSTAPLEIYVCLPFINTSAEADAELLMEFLVEKKACWRSITIHAPFLWESDTTTAQYPFRLPWDPVGWPRLSYLSIALEHTTFGSSPFHQHSGDDFPSLSHLSLGAYPDKASDFIAVIPTVTDICLGPFLEWNLDSLGTILVQFPRLHRVVLLLNDHDYCDRVPSIVPISTDNLANDRAYRLPLVQDMDIRINLWGYDHVYAFLARLHVPNIQRLCIISEEPESEANYEPDMEYPSNHKIANLHWLTDVPSSSHPHLTSLTLEFFFPCSCTTSSLRALLKKSVLPNLAYLSLGMPSYGYRALRTPKDEPKNANVFELESLQLWIIQPKGTTAYTAIRSFFHFINKHKQSLQIVTFRYGLWNSTLPSKAEELFQRYIEDTRTSGLSVAMSFPACKVLPETIGDGLCTFRKDFPSEPFRLIFPPQQIPRLPRPQPHPMLAPPRHQAHPAIPLPIPHPRPHPMFEEMHLALPGPQRLPPPPRQPWVIPPGAEVIDLTLDDDVEPSPKEQKLLRVLLSGKGIMTWEAGSLLEPCPRCKLSFTPVSFRQHVPACAKRDRL
ncbi:hypothetical protein DFP72DRAFT_846860 [Ephemerocybe angulata]|uniref:Uncharacterized protein n=1 Tax=Ephemerocybe angulata TaxID=980116 RepID=A0A8H6HZF5_9AGAR|nr:hypothetical protein DFP72DRAFT_846860 [Tulosesus angulatus]